MVRGGLAGVRLVVQLVLNGTAIQSAIFHLGRADVEITFDPVLVELVRPGGNAARSVGNREGIDCPDDRWRWTAAGRAVQVNGPARVDHLLVEDVRQSSGEVADDQFCAGLAAGQGRLEPDETLVHPSIGQNGLIDPHDVRLREKEPASIGRNVQAVPGPPDGRRLGSSRAGHVASEFHGLADSNNLIVVELEENESTVNIGFQFRPIRFLPPPMTLIQLKGAEAGSSLSLPSYYIPSDLIIESGCHRNAAAV